MARPNLVEYHAVDACSKTHAHLRNLVRFKAEREKNTTTQKQRHEGSVPDGSVTYLEQIWYNCCTQPMTRHAITIIQSCNVQLITFIHWINYERIMHSVIPFKAFLDKLTVP